MENVTFYLLGFLVFCVIGLVITVIVHNNKRKKRAIQNILLLIMELGYCESVKFDYQNGRFDVNSPTDLEHFSQELIKDVSKLGL
jgi:hypothetical protein